MKRLLLIVIPLLFLSIGVSQNRVNVNNLIKYGDKYFKENDDRPFNGIVFDLSKETGNKILQYKMIEGLKNGLYQDWYPDGKPKSKGKYFNNTRVGNWTLWYENVEKKEEGTYKDGKRDGLHTFWYENGEKREDTYKDGKMDGLQTKWYENGQKSYEGTYKDGKKDGLRTWWYENGQKSLEGSYKDGEELSRKRWNVDGSVRKEPFDWEWFK